MTLNFRAFQWKHKLPLALLHLTVHWRCLFSLTDFPKKVSEITRQKKRRLYKSAASVLSRIMMAGSSMEIACLITAHITQRRKAPQSNFGTFFYLSLSLSYTLKRHNKTKKNCRKLCKNAKNNTVHFELKENSRQIILGDTEPVSFQ